jgi:hypothetical protein
MRTHVKIVAALVLAASGPALAEEEVPAAEPASTDEQVRTLAEEIRRLKLEMGLGEVPLESEGGLGPAASKVYHSPRGLSIGGYGEAVYSNELDGAGDVADLQRVVLYLGYRFSERIVFNSEIEFEHAGHEIGVEFAYLDFLLSDAVSVRVGSVLVPVGIANRLHEPAFFNGVFRPDVERVLIPSTWNENGLGLHGRVGRLRYEAYLLAGLDITGGEGVRASSWIRRARTGGSESRADTLAGVLALQADLGPATLGGSLYRGRAGQRARTPAGERIDADVTLGELHATAAWRGLQAKALWAAGRLSDAGLVAEALGLTGTGVIGSSVRGGYLEVGYDLLALAAPGGEAQLSPFVRWEALDLHAAVPSAGVGDPALDQRILTLGLTWKPIPSVAVKGDWQRRDSAAPGAALNQLHLGVGFVF